MNVDFDQHHRCKGNQVKKRCEQNTYTHTHTYIPKEKERLVNKQTNIPIFDFDSNSIY